MSEPWDQIEGVVTIFRMDDWYEWEWPDRTRMGGTWTDLGEALLVEGDRKPNILMDVHRIFLRLIDGRLIREAR